MALTGSLQLSPSLGICKSQERSRQFKYVTGRGNQHLLFSTLSSCASRQDSWTHRLSSSVNKPLCSLPYRCSVLKCHSFLFLGHNVSIPSMETASVALTRSCNALQASPLLNKLVPAVGIIIFTLWGLGPLMRMSRNIFLKKTDSTWKKSTTNLVLTSYLQPMLLWTGLFLICRALDPIVMPTEASELVKQRSLSFVKSLSTVLAFAYCLSSVIQQVQKYLMEANDPSDARNMGFQFAGKAVYSAVWVAAVSLFIELLGFSTQKWMTAGGLGTVLLTLAGREIFTNFLSSIMIHATRPFVLNEWIQTKIEGYEVSGTVENIVADMRKVLAKNPQVEQQKLHRRVFLENINPENQALLILISCFVKTSHHEEYLCVKEGILLDLLRVVSHHRARLATPIRTIQKYYNEPDLDNMSFSSSFFTRGGPVSKSQMLLIEPPYKINGEDKSKSQARTVRGIGEQDSRGTGQPPGEQKTDESKVKGTSAPDLDKKENVKHGNKAEGKVGETLHSRSKDENKASVASKMDWKADSKPTGNSTSRPILELEKDTTDAAGSQSKTAGSVENTSKNSENVLPPLNTETHVINDKTTGSQSKQVEKSTSSESSKQTSASLEENIVLGVALEGSKRTLPIEDELDSPPTPAEAKDLAARSSGPGNSAGEKDGKDK
uniref:Mechanosensitive ion channel protein 2, chloroplastic-like n=1 Tax=Chenopodium quinoa TaxID=63459 RepID=A0A803KXA4_CHEQI